MSIINIRKASREASHLILALYGQSGWAKR